VDTMSVAHKNVFPEKYGDPTTSPLTAEISEGGKPIDFAIKSSK
jgi:hypothetical protein